MKNTKPKLAAVPTLTEHQTDHAAVARAIVARLASSDSNADDDDIIIAANEIEHSLSGIEPLLRQLECEDGTSKTEPYFKTIRALLDKVRSAASNLRRHAALAETGELIGAPNYKGGAK